MSVPVCKKCGSARQQIGKAKRRWVCVPCAREAYKRWTAAHPGASAAYSRRYRAQTRPAQGN